jgi:hypothetical protein
MEASPRHGFSRVRVHDDEGARAHARDLRKRAARLRRFASIGAYALTWPGDGTRIRRRTVGEPAWREPARDDAIHQVRRRGVLSGAAQGLVTGGRVVDTRRASTATHVEHDFGRLLVNGSGHGSGALPDGRDVGRVNDPLEAEADRLAERLMTDAVSSGPVGASKVQSDGLTSASETQARDSQERGSLLPGRLRGEMEQGLGFDLSRVRIHHDDDAARRAAGMSALAFTAGHDISFGAHQYRPDTSWGQRLIAHELIHIVQQSRGREKAPGDGNRDSRGGSALDLSRYVQPDPTDVVRRVPIEGLSAEHELRQQQVLARDRGTGDGAGAGVPFEVLKKAGYDVLIAEARALRLSYVESLRVRSSELPELLQPVAQSVIDEVDADLAALVDLVFFDLGIVVGVGEGLGSMIFGIMPIVVAVVEVAFHYILGIIYLVQQQLARTGLSPEPSEDLIKPVAEDLDAAAKLWHDICYFDLIGYLDGWRSRYQQASSEEQAAMAGEFVGQLATFVATWEASSSIKLGTLKLPLPPSSASPVLIAEVAGGGAIPMAMEASTVSIGVGGPLGGAGAAVTLMSSSTIGGLRQSVADAKERTQGVTEAGPRRAAEKELETLSEDLVILEDSIAHADSAEDFQDWIDSLHGRVDEFQRSLPEKSTIEVDRIVREGIARVDREIAEGERTISTVDRDWLAEDERHKLLSYDIDTKEYRPEEGRSILAGEREGIIPHVDGRSGAYKCDFRAAGEDWSHKGDYRNKSFAEIAAELKEEVDAGRNLYADLESLPLPLDIQEQVHQAVMSIPGRRSKIAWRMWKPPPK